LLRGLAITSSTQHEPKNPSRLVPFDPPDPRLSSL
jgi:hypothetical protein